MDLHFVLKYGKQFILTQCLLEHGIRWPLLWLSCAG